LISICLPVDPMLKINTYLDRSKLSGVGLFAAEDIQRGRTIWEFNPAVDLVFTIEQWEARLAGVATPARDALRRYSYKSNNLLYLCTDNAQFMNHGSETKNIGNKANDDTMYALRDINTGEELLCDYFEFSDADDYHLCRIPPPGSLAMLPPRRRHRARTATG
jgi:SET domain-containing protein